MKNLIVLVVLFFATTVSSAQVKLEVNQEGMFRVEEDQEAWTSSEITSDPEATRYISKFYAAISSPGEKILAEKSEKTLKIKPAFKQLVEVKEFFIIYNSQTKNIDYVEPEPKTREEFSYLILWSITSLLSMIVSNILCKKHFAGTIFAFVAALAALAAISGFAAVAVLSGVFAVFALAAALAATAFSDKYYKVVSIIFYISIVIHIILLFI